MGCLGQPFGIWLARKLHRGIHKQFDNANTWHETAQDAGPYAAGQHSRQSRLSSDSSMLSVGSVNDRDALPSQLIRDL